MTETRRQFFQDKYKPANKPVSSPLHANHSGANKRLQTVERDLSNTPLISIALTLEKRFQYLSHFSWVTLGWWLVHVGGYSRRDHWMCRRENQQVSQQTCSHIRGSCLRPHDCYLWPDPVDRGSWTDSDSFWLHVPGKTKRSMNKVWQKISLHVGFRRYLNLLFLWNLTRNRSDCERSRTARSANGTPEQITRSETARCGPSAALWALQRWAYSSEDVYVAAGAGRTSVGVHCGGIYTLSCWTGPTHPTPGNHWRRRHGHWWRLRPCGIRREMTLMHVHKPRHFIPERYTKGPTKRAKLQKEKPTSLKIRLK